MSTPSPSSPVVSTISPTPTDEELAAIVAALELAWPRPVVLAAQPPRPTGSSWRFSGRWWSDDRIPGAPRRQ